MTEGLPGCFYVKTAPSSRLIKSRLNVRTCADADVRQTPSPSWDKTPILTGDLVADSHLNLVSRRGRKFQNTPQTRAVLNTRNLQQQVTCHHLNFIPLPKLPPWSPTLLFLHTLFFRTINQPIVTIVLRDVSTYCRSSCVLERLFPTTFSSRSGLNLGLWGFFVPWG